MQGNKEKRIIVTGASSFVGAQLAVHFSQRGLQVIGVVNQEHSTPTIQRQRLDWAKKCGVQITTCDLTQAKAMSRLIAEIQPHFFIHHAGWTKHYDSPDYDLMTSFKIHVMPLAEIMDSLAQHQCQGLLITGTSSEYADGETAHNEDEACRPSTPYGLSKFMQTSRAYQLSHLFNLPTRIARLFIPYGLYDMPEKLIPSVVHHLAQKQPIDLTACDQARDFIYIDDVLKAYEILLQTCVSPPLFDVYNIASHAPIRLGDFLREFASVMKADTQLLLFGAKQKRALETDVCYGNNHKLITQGWKPMPLRDGVERYLAVIKDNQACQTT